MGRAAAAARAAALMAATAPTAVIVAECSDAVEECTIGNSMGVPVARR